jgi:hypothetical protein
LGRFQPILKVVENRTRRTPGDKRAANRMQLFELAMLWRLENGAGPLRLGTAMLTNASLGGVQLRTREHLADNDDLIIEVGDDEGPLFLPGSIRYSLNGGPEPGTFGVRFTPKSRAERQAVAKFVLSLAERTA